MHTALSVNVNKIAWLRNAREGNRPDVRDASTKIIQAGAAGITVHPRPDQRHIRPDDVYELSALTKKCDVEFNVEGNPTAGPEANGFPGFMHIVGATRPTQCTLVPDVSTQLTSDHGWNLRDSKNVATVSRYVAELQKLGCRASIFVEADPDMVRLALETQTNRVELFTGPWANSVELHGIESTQAKRWLARYVEAADTAHEIGLAVNAGHDLDLHNLSEFCRAVEIDEVSIGHALVADALDYGIEFTVRKYVDAIQHGCALRNKEQDRH